MKKIILMGRAGSGKTSLMQALRGGSIRYDKTQAVSHGELVIDTPGEYAETKQLGRALALYSYEADVVGLLISATEPFTLFPPNVTACATRPVIGIITKTAHPSAVPQRAEGWLRYSGCKEIFRLDSLTGEGLAALKHYLLSD